jgi:DNA-binding NarL/FixJ family response regulator
MKVEACQPKGKYCDAGSVVNKIQVLVVDDHPIVRSGLLSLLSSAPDIQVIGEAGSGKEAIRLVAEIKPDVLLLDMQLPDMYGNEVARQLREERQPVCILALSAYDDKQFVLELLASGADGYLIKDEAGSMIVEAIRGVARGERGWFSRRISAQLPRWVKDQNRPAQLTDRELQVLGHLVSGLSNQEIAALLVLSEKTVEKHLEEVYSKLGVKSRVAAAVHAIREGLL